MAGALSLFPLIVFSLIFCNTLVIRPETLSTPSVSVFPAPLAALAIEAPHKHAASHGRFLPGSSWERRFTPARDLFSSVRRFSSCPLNRSRLFELDFRRMLMLGGGALAFVVLYSGLMSHSLSEIVLNLEFARVLRPVGDGYFETAMPLSTLMLLFSLLLVFLCGLLDRSRQETPAYARPSSVFACLKIVLLADWPYMHEHHFLFLALWLGVMTATVGVDFRPECRPPIPSLVQDGAVGGIVLCLANVASDVVSDGNDRRPGPAQESHPDTNQQVGPSDYLVLHLIQSSALDATYYNNPIGDSPGRLATAVRLAQASRRLPDCDYVADIRTKRPAVDRPFASVLPGIRRTTGVQGTLEGLRPGTN